MEQENKIQLDGIYFINIGFGGVEELDVEINTTEEQESFVVEDPRLRITKDEECLNVSRAYPSINLTSLNQVYFTQTPKVKLILSKEKRYDIKIDLYTGECIINNLSTDFLDIKTMDGNIIMNDVDILKMDIETYRGDVIANISEFKDNYNSEIINTRGEKEEYDFSKLFSTYTPKTKRLLKIKTTYGRTKVEYKGNR